ncbi:MAG: hypothetical protein SGI71_12290 [Verrucomicrobiota bacterium]|nr:hypothetical protein [Verrucomicrobiota bacterium]
MRFVIESDLMRALAVAFLATAAGYPGACFLRTVVSRKLRFIFVAVLAGILLTPLLLTGYAYYTHLPALTARTFWLVSVYMGILVLKYLPVGTFILCLNQYSNTRASDFIFHSIKPGWKTTLTYLFKNWRASFLASAAVIFLLAFNEFELASLMTVPTWTVTIFEMQAGGYPLLDSFRGLLKPFLIQLLPLCVLLGIAWKWAAGQAVVAEESLKPLQPWQWIPTIVAFFGVTFIPLGMTTLSAVGGFREVLRNFALGSDILFSVGVSVMVSLLTLCLLSQVRRRNYLCALAIPGLTGSLFIALVLVALFQNDILNRMYDTPVPLTIALTLIFLPMTIVCWFIADRFGKSTSAYLAHYLAEQTHGNKARALHWKITHSPKLLVMLIVFYFAYLELTASALLAPSGSMPVTVRLYKLMHYGKTSGFSAMTILSILVPVLFTMIVLGLEKGVIRRAWR